MGLALSANSVPSRARSTGLAGRPRFSFGLGLDSLLTRTMSGSPVNGFWRINSKLPPPLLNSTGTLAGDSGWRLPRAAQSAVKPTTWLLPPPRQSNCQSWASRAAWAFRLRAACALANTDKLSIYCCLSECVGLLFYTIFGGFPPFLPEFLHFAVYTMLPTVLAKLLNPKHTINKLTHYFLTIVKSVKV